jgi:hypothetical protein
MATKIDQAIRLRDLALSLVKVGGAWQESGGGPNMLVFENDNLFISYRSPFQKLPPQSGLDQNLPHGLDIWEQDIDAGDMDKVLSVEWSEKGKFVMNDYVPGPWEQTLERCTAATA